MNKHKVRCWSLTEKQTKFCEEYLIDLNATQAAIRAGYSEKTAYSIGNENLKKPEIQNYIKKRKTEQQEKTDITRDEIIKALQRFGFAEIDPAEIKPKDSIRALKYIAELLGYYETRVDSFDKLDKILEQIGGDI